MARPGKLEQSGFILHGEPGQGEKGAYLPGFRHFGQAAFLGSFWRVWCVHAAWLAQGMGRSCDALSWAFLGNESGSLARWT